MKNAATGAARAMISKGLDLLYPPALYCICCGNIIDESRTYHLCDHCMAHIRWDGQPPQKVKFAGGDGIAGVAGGLVPFLSLRCTQYGLYERRLIFSLKYNGKKYIARDLAQIG